MSNPEIESLYSRQTTASPVGRVKTKVMKMLLLVSYVKINTNLEKDLLLAKMFI